VNTFKEPGIAAGYLKGLEELGIQTPAEVQSQTIPTLLSPATDFIRQEK
jgi:ATP-dependent RNA helicase DeaD